MTITEDSLLYCCKKEKEKKRTKNRIERTEAFKHLQNYQQFNLANCKKCFTFYRVHFRTCTFLLLPEYRSPISTFALVFTLLSVEKVSIFATSAINTCKTLQRRVLHEEAQRGTGRSGPDLLLTSFAVDREVSLPRWPQHTVDCWEQQVQAAPPALPSAGRWGPGLGGEKGGVAKGERRRGRLQRAMANSWQFPSAQF